MILCLDDSARRQTPRIFALSATMRMLLMHSMTAAYATTICWRLPPVLITAPDFHRDWMLLNPGSIAFYLTRPGSDRLGEPKFPEILPVRKKRATRTDFSVWL